MAAAWRNLRQNPIAGLCAADCLKGVRDTRDNRCSLQAGTVDQAEKMLGTFQVTGQIRFVSRHRGAA